MKDSLYWKSSSLLWCFCVCLYWSSLSSDPYFYALLLYPLPIFAFQAHCFPKYETHLQKGWQRWEREKQQQQQLQVKYCRVKQRPWTMNCWNQLTVALQTKGYRCFESSPLFWSPWQLPALATTLAFSPLFWLPSPPTLVFLLLLDEKSLHFLSQDIICNVNNLFQRGSPLYKLFGAGWGQKGVGGFFLKIRPHSCV